MNALDQHKKLKKELEEKIDFFVDGILDANHTLEFETCHTSLGALGAVVFLRKLKKMLPKIHGRMTLDAERIYKSEEIFYLEKMIKYENKRSVKKLTEYDIDAEERNWRIERGLPDKK